MVNVYFIYLKFTNEQYFKITKLYYDKKLLTFFLKYKNYILIYNK